MNQKNPKRRRRKKQKEKFVPKEDFLSFFEDEMIISKELRLRCWQVFTFAIPEIWVNASYRAASQIWNAHVPLSNMHWFHFFQKYFLDRGANRFIMAIFVNTLGQRSTKWKFTKWAIKGKTWRRFQFIANGNCTRLDPQQVFCNLKSVL